MNPKSIFRTFMLLLIVTANIGCDQVTKKIVRKEIVPGESIAVIGHVVTLTNIENSGAFLSLGDSLPGPVKIIVLSVLPLLVLVAGLYILLTRKGMARISVIALGCVIGGGLGNLYDRILYGSVTDFMHINFGIFQTGIFNMADVSIMTGMVLIIINEYTKRKPLEEVVPEV
jgi:signal peptidase II